MIKKNHKGALVTIVDRYSKRVLIKRVETKHADGVTTATITLLKPYSDKVFTITADNGKEFAWHDTISKELDAQVSTLNHFYSWERGLNENTNGLIRQYFPKSSSFETITDEHVEAVMHRLNHRPRKARVTKHLMRCFLHKLNAKPHELWNCIYDLNPSIKIKIKS